jgi:hypothetical protein
LEHFGKIRKILSPIRCFPPAADHPDPCRDCAKERRIDMNMKTLARLFALSGTALCLDVVPGLADNEHCRHVGGSVLTNFLQPADCAASPINLCTDGSSTGDIRGGVGVAILDIKGNDYHVHHHWVTDAGDTIFLKDAHLIAFPTSDPNRVLADYVNGVDITGGTGGFEGAKGTLFAFGGVDLNLGQIVLRYTGTVCFPHVKE